MFFEKCREDIKFLSTSIINEKSTEIFIQLFCQGIYS